MASLQAYVANHNMSFFWGDVNAYHRDFVNLLILPGLLGVIVTKSYVYANLDTFH